MLEPKMSLDSHTGNVVPKFTKLLVEKYGINRKDIHAYIHTTQYNLRDYITYTRIYYMYKHPAEFT